MHEFVRMDFLVRDSCGLNPAGLAAKLVQPLNFNRATVLTNLNRPIDKCANPFELTAFSRLGDSTIIVSE